MSILPAAITLIIRSLSDDVLSGAGDGRIALVLSRGTESEFTAPPMSIGLDLVVIA